MFTNFKKYQDSTNHMQCPAIHLIHIYQFFNLHQPPPSPSPILGQKRKAKILQEKQNGKTD